MLCDAGHVRIVACCIDLSQNDRYPFGGTHKFDVGKHSKEFPSSSLLIQTAGNHRRRPNGDQQGTRKD